MTSLLQFVMVLISDTENANYFCQYIKHFFFFFSNLLNRYLKYIIKVYVIAKH